MCRMGMRDESPRRWLLGLTDQPRITRQRSCRARWRSNNGSSNGENLTPSKALPVVPTSTVIYVVDRSARCPRRSARLFDHLVGEREQLVWNLEAERLRGLEVDRELVLGRCLYRQVGRLLALEDAVDVSGGVPVLVKQIGPIRNQAAAIDHGSPEVNCGQSMPCRERRNQLAIRDDRCTPRRDQTTVRGAREFRDSALNLAGVLRTPSIPRRATAPQN